MNSYPFEKKPAFFPFVSSEIFFEAEAAEDDNIYKIETLGFDLDDELDKILSTI